MTETINWEAETDFEIVAITGEHDPKEGHIKETDIEINKNIENDCKNELDEGDDHGSYSESKPQKEFLPNWSDKLKLLINEDSRINTVSEESIF